MTKRISVFMAILIAALAFWAGKAGATPPNGQLCDGLDSGKIDVVEETTYIWIQAPAGQLIDGYCVKAGSANQGLGAEYFVVDPPTTGVGINHSSWKDISHYSVSYITPEIPDHDFTISGICTLFEDGSREVEFSIWQTADVPMAITAQSPDSGIWSVPPSDTLHWTQGFRHDDPAAGAAWEVIASWPTTETPASRVATVNFEQECPWTPPTTTTSTPPTTIPSSTTTTVPEASTTTVTVPTPTTTTVPQPTPTADVPSDSGVPRLPETGIDVGRLLAYALAAICGGLAILGWQRGR